MLDHLLYSNYTTYRRAHTQLCCMNHSQEDWFSPFKELPQPIIKDNLVTGQFCCSQCLWVVGCFYYKLLVPQGVREKGKPPINSSHTKYGLFLLYIIYSVHNETQKMPLYFNIEVKAQQGVYLQRACRSCLVICWTVNLAFTINCINCYVTFTRGMLIKFLPFARFLLWPSSCQLIV